MSLTVCTTAGKIASQWEAATQHREAAWLCDHLERREGVLEGGSRGKDMYNIYNYGWFTVL